jgi:glycosyltransferase involved in cell wall biosynthesis
MMVMKNKINQNNYQTVIPVTYYFSVIITTYNRENLILRALNSLIAQTESDWEAIIVDDESTDKTYDKIVPYIKAYSKIRYIRQSHMGEAAAKNRGMRSATGRFITFLDSDDEFDLRHLELRKAVLIENTSVKFLYGGVKIIGNHFVPDRFDYSKTIDLNDCIIGGTFFIERNIAISLNGFSDILIGTDADFLERAQNAGVKMMEITHPTYVYHHDTEDSITNKIYPGL